MVWYIAWYGILSYVLYCMIWVKAIVLGLYYSMVCYVLVWYIWWLNRKPPGFTILTKYAISINLSTFLYLHIYFSVVFMSEQKIYILRLVWCVRDMVGYDVVWCGAIRYGVAWL